MEASFTASAAFFAGLLGGPVTGFMWYSILLFEVALALWLIIKGVAAPAPRQPA